MREGAEPLPHIHAQKQEDGHSLATFRSHPLTAIRSSLALYRHLLVGILQGVQWAALVDHTLEGAGRSPDCYKTCVYTSAMHACFS